MSDQLAAAAAAVDCAAEIVDDATNVLARRADDGGGVSVARLDEHQVLAYDLAHAASAVAGSRVMLDYGGGGEYEAMLATAFIADAIWDLGARVATRNDEWGSDPPAPAPVSDFAAP